MSHNLYKQQALVHKSKTVTVLLTLCLGALGAHRFYLGNTKLGVTYLLASCVLGLLFPPALFAITVLLCLEALYFICKGKQYYKRVVEMEVVSQ